MYRVCSTEVLTRMPTNRSRLTPGKAQLIQQLGSPLPPSRCVHIIKANRPRHTGAARKISGGAGPATELPFYGHICRAFRHTDTHLGRAARRDLLPPDVTFLFRSTLAAIDPRPPSTQGGETRAFDLPLFFITSPYIAHRMWSCSAKGS